MFANISNYFSSHGGTVSFISLCLAVLGIAMSVYFYFKSRRRKIPVYRSRTTRIIRSSVNKIDSLEVLYNKKRLNALTITKVAFWNAGKETISSTDISLYDKLRLEIGEGFEFLSCDVVTQTKIANNFRCSIEEDKKTILIEFDYLDYDEGAVLKIRHTGSTNADIVINGSIKGVSAIQIKGGFNKHKNIHIIVSQRIMNLFRWFVGIISIFMVFWGCAMLFESNSTWIEIVESINGDRWIQYLAASSSIVVGVIYMLAVIISVRRKVPKSLEDVYNDGDF